MTHVLFSTLAGSEVSGSAVGALWQCSQLHRILPPLHFVAKLCVVVRAAAAGRLGLPGGPLLMPGQNGRSSTHIICRQQQHSMSSGIWLRWCSTTALTGHSHNPQIAVFSPHPMHLVC